MEKNKAVPARLHMLDYQNITVLFSDIVHAA